MGAGSCPSYSTSHPTACLWPGKAVQECPKPWGPGNCMGDLEVAPGSWIQISTAPNDSIWRMTQWMEKSSILLLSVYLTFQ